MTKKTIEVDAGEKVEQCKYCKKSLIHVAEDVYECCNCNREFRVPKVENNHSNCVITCSDFEG